MRYLMRQVGLYWDVRLPRCTAENLLESQGNQLAIEDLNAVNSRRHIPYGLRNIHIRYDYDERNGTR